MDNRSNNFVVDICNVLIESEGVNADRTNI